MTWSRNSNAEKRVATDELRQGRSVVGVRPMLGRCACCCAFLVWVRSESKSVGWGSKTQQGDT